MTESLKKQIEAMNQQTKELAALYRNAAGRSGVSDNEFWVWYALLVLGGEYSQQDICGLWSLPKQTVNSVINGLAKRGLVSLEAVPGTRNRKLICPTEAGRQYGEALVMEVYSAELRALTRMTEADRETYLRLMDRYIQSLKEELDKGCT